jgi:PEP-CTERM motif
MTRLRIALLVIGLALAMWAAPAKAVIPIITKYAFTGICSDCTGDATGVLVLENYVLGDTITNSNFVSFSYLSNSLSFGFGEGDLMVANGTLPTLPSKADVLIQGIDVFFTSQTNGFWCAGIGTSCAPDSGSSLWVALPEPSTWWMMLLGFAVLALAGFRRIRATASAA